MSKKEAKCDGCGLDYKEFGLDAHLPNLQWSELTTDGATLLCANCICKRAAQMPDALAVRMVIEVMWPTSKEKQP